MRKRNSFSIDIALRHPSYGPGRISEALSLKPHGSRTVGQKDGGPTAQSSLFYASLERGEASSEYESALTRVTQFIEKHGRFWRDFITERGEMELVLNHTIPVKVEPGDLCLRLGLEPRLLAQLSNSGFGLRFQAWKAGSGARVSPGRSNRTAAKRGKRAAKHKRR